MALDGDGNIYVTGQSQDINGEPDWATIKYTPEGKHQWVLREDGPAHGEDKATAIAVDGPGNVYVAGSQTKTNGLIEQSIYNWLSYITLQLPFCFAVTRVIGPQNVSSGCCLRSTDSAAALLPRSARSPATLGQEWCVHWVWRVRCATC